MISSQPSTAPRRSRPPLPHLTLMATAAALIISLTSTLWHRYQATAGIPREAQISPADTSAWYLGIDHAAHLVNDCTSDNERALILLDVRARETNIRLRLGQSAGDAYVKGFEHGLRLNSDSLADVILGE